MIIKIATGKDESGKIQWTHLYSSAIRNRLRRSLNLADIPDTAEARKNLGIEAYIGDLTEALYESLKKYVDQQDVSYDKAVRTYITNNVETRLDDHDAQLTDLYNTMLPKKDFDDYFKVSWDKRIPKVIEDLKKYSDDNLAKAKQHSDSNLGTAKSYTNTEISKLETNLKAYVDGQVKTLGERIGKVETSVSNLGTRVNNMVSTINTNFRDISKDLDYIATTAEKLILYLNEELGVVAAKLTCINYISEAILNYLSGGTIQTAASAVRTQVNNMHRITDATAPRTETRVKYTVKEVQ